MVVVIIGLVVVERRIVVAIKPIPKNRQGLQPRDRMKPTPMKTLSPTDAFVVKELRRRIKFLSRVRVVKWFGTADRVAKNFTEAVTRDFVR